MRLRSCLVAFGATLLVPVLAGSGVLIARFGAWHDPVRPSWWVLLACGSGLVVVGALPAAVVGRSITRRVHALLAAAEAVGRGAGVGQGVVTDACAIADHTGRTSTDDDGARAQAFAGQAAVDIENAGLLDAERRNRERLALSEARYQQLFENVNDISSTLDVTDVMRRVAREAGHMLGADMVGAYLADAGEDVLVPIAGYHVPEHLLEAFREFPVPLKGHEILEAA